MTKRLAIACVGLCFIALAAAPRSARAQEAAPAAAGTPSIGESAVRAFDQVHYGVGLRMPRWVLVPQWFLGLFTAQNVPLSTFSSFGGEFFRRKGDLDIVLGVSYQNMSPKDGNWLGRGKNPAIAT